MALRMVRGLVALTGVRNECLRCDEVIVILDVLDTYPVPSTPYDDMPFADSTGPSVWCRTRHLSEADAIASVAVHAVMTR